MTRGLLLLAIGALLVTTSCSDAGEPGKAAVTDELSAIWGDLGVGADQAALQGYGVDRDVESAACAGRDEPDRWIARRSAILPGGIVTQDAVIAGLAERYRSAGTVRLFRATGGATNVFVSALDTERRIVVRAHVDGDGRTSVQVRHSPCPVDDLATGIRGPYTEVDLPTG